MDDAVKALRSLKLKPREARALVQRVVERNPGVAWDASDLVRAALQELPATG